jgi:uncharacterized membrane protein
VVNSEKTIFMKRDGGDWIIHGLYVDEMIYTSTSDTLKKEFIEKYTSDFDITWEDTMTSFLCLKIEQSRRWIDIHLDTYIKEVLDEYQLYTKKELKPKKVPMQPGVVLDNWTAQ